MPTLRRTALPWACLFLLALLAACGGGSSSDESGRPAGPDSPSLPAEPGGPGQPDAPAPAVALWALAGSAGHGTLGWHGGRAGLAWRLERRRADGGDAAWTVEVDSGAGLWLDSGLVADTAYHYRLLQADGSVVATASLRTGTEEALTTAAPEATGERLELPVSSAAARLQSADGDLQLALPAGSLAQPGTATLQPIANPLPDGVGPGMRLSLPARPTQALTLALRYGSAEDPDEAQADRVALRQADGSWWLLPLAGHDAGQRLLQVALPPGLWPERATAATPQARASAQSSVAGVQGEFVRVKAHKLLPAAATLRVLDSQRFVPVSIYVMRGASPCDSTADELCVPAVVLRDASVPILNAKAGFARGWRLEGSSTPPATQGALAVAPSAGVVYTAPAQLPASNPLTLRFESHDLASGRRLALRASIRIAEDAWVGTLKADMGDPQASHHFTLDTRWQLDAAQSTATRRVYLPGGEARHDYTVADPVCRHTVAPAQLPLAQAQTSGQLVVDAATTPARYTLELAALWTATLTVDCPRGSVATPAKGGHVWSATGELADGRIQGADSALGERSWSLQRPQ